MRTAERNDKKYRQSKNAVSKASATYRRYLKNALQDAVFAFFLMTNK